MAYDLTLASIQARKYGYEVVQRSAFSGAPTTALGWTDHSTNRHYVFTDRLLSLPASIRPEVARKIAMHEVGHGRWSFKGRFPDYWRYCRAVIVGSNFNPAVSDQRVEEDYCEIHSHLLDYQFGVSYSIKTPIPTANQMLRLQPLL